MLFCMSSDVTRILSAIEQGDPHAAEKLLPLVYDELRNLAAHRLAQEKPGQTLAHEAYIRLVGGGSGDAGDGSEPPRAMESGGWHGAHLFLHFGWNHPCNAASAAF